MPLPWSFSALIVELLKIAQVTWSASSLLPGAGCYFSPGEAARCSPTSLGPTGQDTLRRAVPGPLTQLRGHRWRDVYVPLVFCWEAALPAGLEMWIEKLLNFHGNNRSDLCQVVTDMGSSWCSLLRRQKYILCGGVQKFQFLSFLFYWPAIAQMC